MKTHVHRNRVRCLSVNALVLILTIFIAVPAIPAQAPPSQPRPPETIPAGSLVIPMDNYHQGNAAETTFNLRAYGLANLMLQNGIPLKWIIKPGKSKDAVDFTANVTRVAGVAGDASNPAASFAGGPFVIHATNDTPFVRNLIATFNATVTPDGPVIPVTVYETNADAIADVRYNVTHKPKIAVGPDGGNFGAFVYQELFNRAGIPNYTNGVEDIGSQGACYTLATQGHTTNPQYVNEYKQFVQGGGNLILQCASIDTYENNINGHFQTTPPGYTVFTSNPPTPTEINSNNFVFPEGSMPFNQFIGMLADQDGVVTEYKYAPGAGPNNGNRVSVTNSVDPNIFVATVSQLLGADAVGGVVFELGGHNYARPDDGSAGPEVDSALAMINGQRMSLNTVFVPAETVCTTPTQSIIGYKSVRRFNVRNGGPPLIKGDTVEWTIDYINNSPDANQENFQITDKINEFNQHLDYVEGSAQITLLRNGASATINPNFDGASDLNLLSPGAEFPIGARIQIKLRTIIMNTAPTPYVLFNQTTASSNTLAASGTTKSDAIDATNASIFSEAPPPPGSIQQVQNGSTINPTRIEIASTGTTAGEVSVEGHVIDNTRGAGIANALVTVANVTTGQTSYATTNAFGFFRIEGLDAGGLYTIRVTQKRYIFPADPVVLSLGDDVTGLTITGRLPETKPRAQVRADAAKPQAPAKGAAVRSFR